VTVQLKFQKCLTHHGHLKALAVGEQWEALQVRLSEVDARFASTRGKVRIKVQSASFRRRELTKHSQIVTIRADSVR